MEKIVLLTSRKRLHATGNKIICLTFLTTRGSVWRMIPLMIQTYFKIKWHLPYFKFSSLSLLLDKRRVHFFDMRLSLAPSSLISLFTLKKLCVKLERNKRGFRKADIDVYIASNGQPRQLYKLSNKIIPTYLS